MNQFRSDSGFNMPSDPGATQKRMNSLLLELKDIPPSQQFDQSLVEAIAIKLKEGFEILKRTIGKDAEQAG